MHTAHFSLRAKWQRQVYLADRPFPRVRETGVPTSHPLKLSSLHLIYSQMNAVRCMPNLDGRPARKVPLGVSANYSF